MVRPRWHDALITLAIVGLAAFGVWALWWDDVRSLLHLGGDEGSAAPSDLPAPAPRPQT